MKTITALLLFLCANSASAELNCDAQEIVGGKVGRTAPVVIGQNPFFLKWSDDTIEMTGKNSLCGVIMNRSTLCQTVDTSSGQLISARMLCADASVSPLENKVGEAYFSYNLSVQTGRFACAYYENHEIHKVEQTLELKNCR